MVAQLDLEVIRAAPGRVVPRLLSYALFEGRPATTKGRWVNPVAALNLRFGEWRAPTRPVTAPVFLVGIGRSGTTLLGRLFGAHPDVGFLNEPKLLWHRLVPDEDIIGSYGAEPARLRLDGSDATPERRRRAHRLVGWYLWVTRSVRLVDKYPELVFRTDLVRALFPDAHLVVIQRHPWDVVTSITRWGETHATDTADWWGIDDRKWRVIWGQGLLPGDRWPEVVAAVDPGSAGPIVRAAVEWLVGTTEALDVLDRLADERVHPVRYEDLVARPAETMSALLDRCGLDRQRAVVDLAGGIVSRRHQPSPPPDLPAPLVSAIEVVARRAGY